MKSGFSGSRRRPRTTAQERTQWVQRFERSGLSRREFALRHGLVLSTLVRWLAHQPLASVLTPLLREVSLGQVLGQPQWIAEVQRPDGLTVRLSATALPLVEALLTCLSF